jgi:hypothetical protein
MPIYAFSIPFAGNRHLFSAIDTASVLQGAAPPKSAPRPPKRLEVCPVTVVTFGGSTPQTPLFSTPNSGLNQFGATRGADFGGVTP